MSKSFGGWKKKWPMPRRNSWNVFNEELEYQRDLAADVDVAIFKVHSNLSTPGYISNMTLQDRKSCFNVVGDCLEDLIYHEGKFLQLCERKIQEKQGSRDKV